MLTLLIIITTIMENLSCLS